MKLSYGVSSAEIPDDCAAALGYRAILRNGHIDLVYDRVDRCMVEVTDWHGLQRWYEAKGVAWLDDLADRIWGNDPMTYALDDGRFHVRASAQASYGYLYVTVWMDPEGSAES